MIRAPGKLGIAHATSPRVSIVRIGVASNAPDVARRYDRPAPEVGVRRASLDDVRVIRQALGGTVNDVVLAAVTSGSAT